MSTVTKGLSKGKSKGSGTRYTAEFRREALRLLDGGKAQTDVATELGIALGTLQRWRLKAEAGAARGVPPGASGESVTAENDRLKRENRALRSELEFAKKAASFFARHGR